MPVSRHSRRMRASKSPGTMISWCVPPASSHEVTQRRTPLAGRKNRYGMSQRRRSHLSSTSPRAYTRRNRSPPRCASDITPTGPGSGQKMGVGGFDSPPSLNTRSIRKGLRSLRHIAQLPSPAWHIRMASRGRSIMYISLKSASPHSAIIAAIHIAAVASPSAA